MPSLAYADSFSLGGTGEGEDAGTNARAHAAALGGPGRGGLDDRSAAGGGPAVLVVDDDSYVLGGIARVLERAGYSVMAASRGAEAVGIARDCHPRLVLLDVMMPGIDGFEACRRIRQFSSVPIIMLSGMGDPADKVRGLRTGADDYVAKPFSRDELLARMDALLRRSQPAREGTGPVISRGDLSIDLLRRLVTVRGSPVELTPMEYKLLLTLAESAERVMGHAELLGTAWGPGYRSDVGYLRVYIRRLRLKLERDPANPEYIRTVSGVGYALGGGKQQVRPEESVSADTEKRSFRT